MQFKVKYIQYKITHLQSSCQGDNWKSISVSSSLLINQGIFPAITGHCY